jgi:hypothetical protein
MSNESPAYVLTVGQRRRLETTLMRLSDEAREMADAVRAEGEHPDEDSELARRLERISEEAEQLAGELGLTMDRHPVSVRRRLHAWASLSWSDVLDSGPAALRGYGAVDVRTADFLGPRIERLAEQLLVISARSRATPDP